MSEILSLDDLNRMAAGHMLSYQHHMSVAAQHKKDANTYDALQDAGWKLGPNARYCRACGSWNSHKDKCYLRDSVLNSTSQERKNR